jgi:hypothetical protein
MKHISGLMAINGMFPVVIGVAVGAGVGSCAPARPASPAPAPASNSEQLSNARTAARICVVIDGLLFIVTCEVYAAVMCRATGPIQRSLYYSATLS